jgi:medium-chain acyl-[acyl-carrier-protein] hydrolase
MFRRWPDLHGTSADVYPVQLPGRETRIRERPRTDLRAIVGELAEAITPALARRAVLFGYSLGALVAFELAREFRRRDVQVRGFIAAAAAAPQLVRTRTALHALEDADLICALRDMGATPEEILAEAEMMRLLLPTVRADFALLETYRYRHEPPLDVPILALGGTHDREVSLAQLRGWREQTCSEFEVKAFVGDHFFLRTQERRMLTEIASFVAEVSAPPRSQPSAYAAASTVR